MINLKNNVIFLFMIIALSCNVHGPVDKGKLVGMYTAVTPGFIDTLIIYGNFTYFHAIHGTEKKFFYSQFGNWKATVENYYDLLQWRTDSTVRGGADILPLFNKLTGSITFAYPLVTAEDIDYVKIQSVSK
jgi:hypothetical protein